MKKVDLPQEKRRKRINILFQKEVNLLYVKLRNNHQLTLP
jgi:hypothetical protein